MFHPQPVILILLCLFFIINHSSLRVAGNFPTPNFPDDNNANYDYCHLYNNLASPNSVPSAPRQRKLAFGRVNAIATVVTILLSLLNIIVYKLRKLQEANFCEQLNVPKGKLCRRFFLNDILLATNYFDDDLVIGQGGFGKVYKGVIDNGTITVAIKRLNRTSRQGAREFWTEVEMLSKFQHSHVVSLIGYCNNCNEMILVYEYMIHGNLADHLHKDKTGTNGNTNSTLCWVQRLKICIGAARGLDYLHTGTGIQHRVIHRDVKSSNILLDENWEAKISDFGLSKTGPANQSCTHVSTNVKGTFGYLDLEYFLTHRLTRKSDVYAFGVVLFEVLCGRQAVDERLEEEQWSLARWAQLCVKEGRLECIIDASLKWEIFPNSLNAFAQIATQCLHYRSKKRPTMAGVVAALESALALQQKRDSSMIEMENFDTCGIDDNQENADSSTEQQEVIGDGDGNGVHREEQIDGIRRSDDARSIQETIHENLDTCRGQEEVISACNEEKQINEFTSLDNGSTRLPRVKLARIAAFTRMVRQFFQGTTAQATSVNTNTKLPKNGGKSNNNRENSTSLNKDVDDVLQSPLSGQMETPNVKKFTYNALKTATRNFGMLIDQDIFSCICKGRLNEKTYGASKVGVGMAVFVKLFDFQEHLWQEQSHVKLLNEFRHPNLVNVLGYCLEDEKFLLMQRGSLERYLFGSQEKPLSWATRLKISLGAARGIVFMHSTTKKQGSFRLFETGDILLDQDFNAKLSYVELALMPNCKRGLSDNYYLPGLRKCRSVSREDTYKGAPPEYLSTGLVSRKSHIYCFGVVLLEILTGMRASALILLSGRSNLVDGSKYLLSNKRSMWEIIDPRLGVNYPIKGASQYAQLTLECLSYRPEDRPLMKEILKALEGIPI